ncbi:MAG: hypothetical protein C4570_06180, partial [Ammonifex sp.]
MEAVKRLINILEEQRTVIKKIIAVTEREMKAFTIGDHNGILEGAGDQEKLTAELVGLENNRHAALQAMEEELHLPKSCKLGELLNFIPAEFKTSLAELNECLERDVSVLLLLQSRLYFLLQRALIAEETFIRILCRAGLGEGFLGMNRQLGFIDRSV